MRGGDIDLRDLPWYFWLGLGLEVIGGVVGMVFHMPPRDSMAGQVVGLCIFFMGFALAGAAFISGQRRDGKADRDEADGRPGTRPCRRAPVLGAFLLCFGVLGGVVCVRAGGSALSGLVVVFFAVVLGIIYFFDRSVPGREFRAKGQESHIAVRLAVHLKYAITISMCAGMIVFAWFFKPRPSAATSQRIEWWVFVVVVTLSAVVFAGKYVWHCWIKKDYEEPEFRHG